MMRHLLQLSVLACMCLLPGCSGQEDETEPVSSPIAQEVLSSADQADEDDAESDEVPPSPIDDVSTAAAADTIDEANADKVHTEVTEDEAMEYDDFDVGFDDDHPLPPAEAITREEFDACWQTSLTAVEEPAGELLQRITEECALDWEEQPQFAEALAIPVNIELNNVSRLRIIEEICSQVGLYPRYRLDEFAVAAGPRPYPVAFAGPFIVEVRELQETPPHGTGLITLQFTGCTMSQDANSWVQSRPGRVSAVASIRGTGGVDVSEHYSYGREYPTATAQMLRFRSQQNLMSLAQGVEQIELLAGTIAFEIPENLHSAQFDDLSAGQTAQLGPHTIELGSIELGNVSRIILFKPILLHFDLSLIARDSAGVELESTPAGFVAAHELWTIQGIPASIEVHQVDTTDVSYPFELMNIQLERFAEQPAVIEPLRFEGDLPVELNYLRMEDDGIAKHYVIEAVNHTNKDLGLIEIWVHSFDADGGVVGFDSQSHTGFPALEQGATVEILVPAYADLEDAVDIRPQPMAIRALDATSWRAEQ